MVKKSILIIIILLLTACTNVNDMNISDIANNLGIQNNNANVYKKGFRFYMPDGLAIKDVGSNYVILNSSKTDYYLYVDFISYLNGKKIEHTKNPNATFYKDIKSNGVSGYIEIILKENNQYLIEIMYNYAKIEVIVEEDLVNVALCNSISILNSIKYNKLIIEHLLEDDDLDYTEEIYDMFEETKDNPNILDYIEIEDEEQVEEEIKDTDFIN